VHKGLKQLNVFLAPIESIPSQLLCAACLVLPLTPSGIPKRPTCLRLLRVATCTAAAQAAKRTYRNILSFALNLALIAGETTAVHAQ
jgi:hypothetical protein